MRRAVNLAIAMILLFCGLAATIWLLLYGQEVRFLMIFGAGFVSLAGFLWIYDEYWPGAQD